MTWSLLASPFSLSADRLPQPWGQGRVHTAKEQCVSLETLQGSLPLSYVGVGVRA